MSNTYTQEEMLELAEWVKANANTSLTEEYAAIDANDYDAYNEFLSGLEDEDTTYIVFNMVISKDGTTSKKDYVVPSTATPNTTVTSVITRIQEDSQNDDAYENMGTYSTASWEGTITYPTDSTLEEFEEYEVPMFAFTFDTGYDTQWDEFISAFFGSDEDVEVYTQVVTRDVYSGRVCTYYQKEEKLYSISDYLGINGRATRWGSKDPGIYYDGGNQ